MVEGEFRFSSLFSFWNNCAAFFAQYFSFARTVHYVSVWPFIQLDLPLDFDGFFSSVWLIAEINPIVYGLNIEYAREPKREEHENKNKSNNNKSQMQPTTIGIIRFNLQATKTNKWQTNKKKVNTA